MNILLSYRFYSRVLNESKIFITGEYTDEYRVGFRYQVNSAEDAKSEMVNLIFTHHISSCSTSYVVLVVPGEAVSRGLGA